MTVIIFRTLEDIPIIQAKSSDWSKIPPGEINKMIQLQRSWERGMKDSKTPLGEIEKQTKLIADLRN